MHQRFGFCSLSPPPLRARLKTQITAAPGPVSRRCRRFSFVPLALLAFGEIRATEPPSGAPPILRSQPFPSESQPLYSTGAGPQDPNSLAPRLWAPPPLAPSPLRLDTQTLPTQGELSEDIQPLASKLLRADENSPLSNQNSSDAAWLLAPLEQTARTPSGQDHTTERLSPPEAPIQLLESYDRWSSPSLPPAPGEARLGDSLQPTPWTPAGLLQPSDWSLGQQAVTRESLLRTSSPLVWVWGLRSAAISDSNPSLTRSAADRALRLELGPQARIQLGREESQFQAGAGYSGSYTRNLDAPHQPFFEHRASLDTRWLMRRLMVGLRGTLNLQQNGSRDTGARSTERTISGRLQTNFQATEKISNELSLDLNRSRFPKFSGSDEARARTFFDYALGAKLQFGIGAGLGVLEPQNGESQRYVQALARAAYQPTSKLLWNASFGIEQRRIETEPEPNSELSLVTVRNPVFSLTGLWSASARTSFILEAERRSLSSSILQDTNFESTRIKLGWNEQLTPLLQARLSAGYERADYQTTLATRTSPRQDDYWLGRIEIQWAPRKHSSLGLFWESSANHSSQPDLYSFRRHQLGLTWSLHF